MNWRIFTDLVGIFIIIPLMVVAVILMHFDAKFVITSAYLERCIDVLVDKMVIIRNRDRL